MKDCYLLKLPRSNKHIPSLNSEPNNAYRKETQYYTGTKLLGIATMHKSNAVPVFSKQQARETKKND